MRRMLLAGLVSAVVATGTARAAAESPDRYDVVWDTPSEDARGSMPLGNGDISLNTWVEPNGDLLFYIGKSDSWDENARLLKVGRVRFRIEPCPLTGKKVFEQRLHLGNATVEVRYGEGDAAVRARVWVDANHPVIQTSVASPTPVTVTATIEPWRTGRVELPQIETSDVLLDRSKPNQQRGPTFIEPDVVLSGLKDRMGWYHHNARSLGPELTMKIQGLAEYPLVDPLLKRTFGAIVEGAEARRIDDVTLKSEAKTAHDFSTYVLTSHPATPEEWLEQLEAKAAEINALPCDGRRRSHDEWWVDFWNRSWINVSCEAAAGSLIPGNRHPVRVGEDQQGSNRFRGEIGRVTLLGRALGEEGIVRLAGTQPNVPLAASPDVLGSWRPATGVVGGWQEPPSALTVEAWIKPGDLPPSGGRIVDRITPGGSDGMLLDTFPGRSLRLIVGNRMVHVKDCLAADRWQHVAAVIGGKEGVVRLYLDGRLLASDGELAGDEGTVVSRGYALQRFINACAGRGRYPIKFNGSTFTMPWPGMPGDADYRRWGPGYWWQNTRLPYIGMCASGDFDLMEPLFRMYVDELLPLCQYRTRRYFNHDGAYYPECIYFWGAVFSETYGWEPFEDREDKLQSSGWHKWEWVCGPELGWMLLDYYDHTLDEQFLKTRALPLIEAVQVFFDRWYKTDPSGKLVMHPSQSLETWWECTNPMPELAGLHAITERVLALPERFTTPEQRQFWLAFQRKLPDLPVHEVEGKRMLAPAAAFDMKRNIENPELYAVFPFRQIAIGRGGLDLAIETLKHRQDRGNFGWRQDDVFMAYLGLPQEAREYLVGRARRKDPDCRFPAFWGPNYDWTPDQDHGGILVKVLQAMALQSDPVIGPDQGGRIYVLPAWPEDWDVEFKLHAPRQTVVECVYRDGRIERLEIKPAERRRDVVLPAALVKDGSPLENQ